MKPEKITFSIFSYVSRNLINVVVPIKCDNIVDELPPELRYVILLFINVSFDLYVTRIINICTTLNNGQPEFKELIMCAIMQST